MLFLVISTTPPSRPEEVRSARLAFRSWIAELQSKDKVVSFYPRVGRGSVVIFDVSSNDELHELMTQWTNLIPVFFDIFPLATPAEAEKLLR
jgi:muconolactone delta-isomerase